MADFQDSPKALVADVDCTAEGKDLCEKFEVRGYPTIKYGDPDEMKDYQGGRSYEDLKKFADENLGPTCGPGENIELCDEETRKRIETYVKMSVGKLEGKIRNTIKAFEVELPMMKKVVAYLKSEKGGSAEL
mmetsp:Transcript_66199/g.191056  ORF Transcript_66199/g.191056 Transcript_66199/m.191056 type:complete len:132 (-) Transcript_66199:85-480(-)